MLCNSRDQEGGDLNFHFCLYGVVHCCNAERDFII